MAAVSVMYNPSYSIGYDVDATFLNELPIIASRAINSYKDSSNIAHDLLVGASSNLNLESKNDTNIFVYQGSSVKIYETTVQDEVRTDRNILTISDSNNTTTLIAPEAASSNSVILKAADPQNTVTVGSMTLNNSAGYQMISTTAPNGFIMSDLLSVNGSVTAAGDLVTQMDIKAAGDMFGRTMNLYKNVGSSNLSQVAYAFYINEYNQLELLRYQKFPSESNILGTSAQEKIMTFGTAIFNQNGHKEVPFSTSNYQALDVFNGLASSSNGSGNLSGGSGGFGGGSSPFLVNTSGNVYLPEGTYLGLGTSEPAYNLDVNGTISSTNVIVSPQFLSSSDQRLKENIKIISDVSSCLDILKKLNIYNYNFKMDEDKRLRTGFIAQEVKRQIPNAVIQTEFAGLSDCMQIDTDVLIAYLVGAVKSLSSKVDSLANQIGTSA